MKLSFSLFEFLSLLEQHNNREWFNAHKDQYDSVKAEISDFTVRLIEKISTFDVSIRRETPKTSIFRIYRDIRFSPDKTPYKTHFGIYVAPGGKSGPFAGYYLHLQNNASNVSGGLWCPDSSNLKKIREEIYYEPEPFHSIVTDPIFKKRFGSLQNLQKLTRPPKNYPADFPYLDYLKHRHFIVSSPFSNEEVLSPSFIDVCTSYFETMFPLVKYLNTLLLYE